MSRRYIKNALFFLLFSALAIAVYTVFLGAKKGVERSGWKGFVQNMAVGQNGQQVEADTNNKAVASGSDFMRDDQREKEDEQGRRLEHNIIQAHDLEQHRRWPGEHNDEEEADLHPAPVEDVRPKDFNEDEDHQGEVPEIGKGKEKELVHPLLPNFDPEDVKLRDDRGQLVGFKLFPNGIQPDHDKSPEERIRDLRNRLGLPPAAERKIVVATPIPKVQLELPRKVINAGEIPSLHEKPIDNLGAFRLRDKYDRINHLPVQDNVENRHDDRFADVRKRPHDFNLRGRDYVNANRGHLLQSDQLGQRHGIDGNVNDNIPPRSQNRSPFNGDKHGPNPVILRPIGSNGRNPFHRPKIANNDVMPNDVPQKKGWRLPEPPQKNDIHGNVPLNNNMIPLNQERADNHLLPHQMPDNQGMNPFAHNQQGMREDLLQREHAANNDIHPLAPNGQILNKEEMHPFDRNHPRGREDLLQRQHAANNDIHPLEPNGQALNREDNSQHDHAIDNIQNANEGHAAHLTNDANPEIQDVEQVETLEGEKEEPESPLHIENIAKPLPVDLDCIPFVFPVKRGTLCVHDVDHDKAMSGAIKSSGIWEPDMLAEFSLILKSDKELGVVDIGAGIGVYSIAAALMDRKVVAVEPLNKNYRLLHKSALENEVSSKITLVTQAIGSESYKGHLHYDDQSGGYSQTRIEKILEEQAYSDPTDVVQVTTLNNLVQALPFGSAILKIDVGGFMEADVLKSSSKFFKAVHVPYILTHWNFPTGLTKKIEVITLLSQLGYRPKLQWDGSEANPELLKGDIRYLVWASD